VLKNQKANQGKYAYSCKEGNDDTKKNTAKKKIIHPINSITLSIFILSLIYSFKSPQANSNQAIPLSKKNRNPALIKRLYLGFE
jgi:hypothetical protein